MLKSDATCFQPKDATPVAHKETPNSWRRFAKALASHEWEKTALALQRSGATFQDGFLTFQPMPREDLTLTATSAALGFYL
ncbi:hypothetical protein [Nostoc sp.]|uniref:hypothetical protein n=1 Tax=Nostoc sp. TaxID=1180 RepID=UPI002FFCBFC3